MIEKAAKHILSILAKEPVIKYSRFYDGTEETENSLRKVFDLPEDDDHAEILMDEGAWLLEEKGFVVLRNLDDTLSDGEPNYEIKLTEAGAEFLKSGHLQL